jgi:hypothetical protein
MAQRSGEGGDQTDERSESSESGTSPVDLLVDLFVYAPVGLLYEFDDVFPQLIRRGKSQVQLAQVIAKMASNGQGPGVGSVAGTVAGNVAGNVAEMATRQLAQMITDFGASIGLAPAPASEEPTEPSSTDESSSPAELPSGPDGSTSEGSTTVEPKQVAKAAVAEAAAAAEAPVQLPIARYDELTAKEIIGLLDDLDPDQRDRIRAYETAHRARKTVIGKLDRLQG